MNEKNKPFSIKYRFTRFFFYLMYFPFVRKINGGENLPHEGPFIAAANHASIIDGFLFGIYLTRIMNRHLHVFALKRYYRNPLWAMIFETMQSICVDQDEIARSILIALAYLKKGEAIGIFPEMYRSPDGKIKKAKTGVAALALIAKVPVVPVGLLGTYEIMPRGKFIPRLARCEINIGVPLEFRQYFKDYDEAINRKDQAKIREIEEEVVRIIMKEIAKLSNQEYPF